MDLVCTNSNDFYNYLLEKGVKAFLYEAPVQINGILNIFFPCTHNITICGNRYNTQRIASGEMKKELQALHDLISCDNTIVITPITLFNGRLHKIKYPESMLYVKRQRIHTSKLGELVYPHFIHIYGAELKPVTDIEPVRDYVEYGNEGKRQDTLYWNVFYNKCSKEERRKKRHIPEYALYSALYNQIIKEDK